MNRRERDLRDRFDGSVSRDRAGSPSVAAPGRRTLVEQSWSTNQLEAGQSERTEEESRAYKLLVRLNRITDEADFRHQVAELGSKDMTFLNNHVSDQDQEDFADLLVRIRNERLVSSAEGLEGEAHWGGPSVPDPAESFQIDTETVGIPDQPDDDRTSSFAIWVRGGPPPGGANRLDMNCWEMILYAGWRAGVISYQWIVDLHARAARAGRERSSAASDRGSRGLGTAAYFDVLEDALGVASAMRWSPGTPTVAGTPVPAPLPATAVAGTPVPTPVPATLIPRGSLVFFNGLAHVALSTGNIVDGEHEVISLWIVPPTEEGVFNRMAQRTTVEDIVTAAPQLSGSVTFGPNPWAAGTP
jgi:hypothetical protein